MEQIGDSSRAHLEHLGAIPGQSRDNTDHLRTARELTDGSGQTAMGILSEQLE